MLVPSCFPLCALSRNLTGESQQGGLTSPFPLWFTLPGFCLCTGTQAEGVEVSVGVPEHPRAPRTSWSLLDSLSCLVWLNSSPQLLLSLVGWLIGDSSCPPSATPGRHHRLRWKDWGKLRLLDDASELSELVPIHLHFLVFIPSHLSLLPPEMCLLENRLPAQPRRQAAGSGVSSSSRADMQLGWPSPMGWPICLGVARKSL